jgi:RimJ/RimL family protein N-acetyltransferase
MILLREPSSEDAAQLVDAVQESLQYLEPWMPWAVPTYGLGEAAQWIRETQTRRQAGSAYEFFIVDSGERLLGTCGLNQIDAANRRANLGYWVRSAASGRGVAPAAVGQLAQWGFAHTDLERLEIVIALGNERSRRVAEKVGAVREGLLRSRLWLYGVPTDAIVYSLVRRAH